MPDPETPSHSPAYRPDIDGLRAVAVLAVVGFHAFPGRMPGGFIGVDVFFVISGFLITSIITSDLQRGEFSVARFYARRVRRIFPSLLVVLAAALALAWPLMLNDEFRTFGRHVAGGAAFVSNWLLRGEAGYFDEASELKPLLHLWSLAVEEQFYVVWPLLLWLLRGRSPRLVWVLVIVVGGASFADNLYLVQADRAAAFYGPGSRFWELMAGAGLVPLAHRFPRSPGVVATSLSLAGALLLAAGLAFTRREVAFPGWWALLPVAGTCLLVAAGPQGLFNAKLLSTRPFVAVGLISYPLYLWHWVFLSYAFIYTNYYVPTLVKLAAVALSFVLAWACWRFVESPIRFGRAKRFSARWLAAGMACASVLGLLVAAGAIRNSSRYFEIEMTEAQINSERSLSTQAHSLRFDDAPVRVVLFGDSQARDLFRAFSYDSRLGLRYFTSPSACTAFSEASEGNTTEKARCKALFDELLHSPELRRADYLVYSRLHGDEAEPPDAFLRNVAALRAANSRLQIQVWGPKPYVSGRAMSIRRMMRDYDGKTGINDYLGSISSAPPPTQTMLHVLSSAGVRWIDVQGIFCKGGCTFYESGQYAYFDFSHWTEAGVRVFVRKLEASGLDPFPPVRPAP